VGKIGFNKIRKFSRYSDLMIGKMLRNSVHAYWYDAVPNFGDLLNPLLLRYYGLTPIKENRITANVFVIGSVLDEIHEDFSGYIIGSGLMRDNPKTLNYAKILALRGRLTQERLHASRNIVLGDPGLLTPRIIRKREKKKFMLGLVPHYFDKNDIRIRKIKNHYPDDVLVIDVQQRPQTVISCIDQCAYVLSSSLHGLVTADSLGIPSGWINLSEKVEGKGFKFLDYASAFNMDLNPKIIQGDERLSELVKLTRRIDGILEQVQSDLDAVFRKFSKVIIEQQKISGIKS